VSRQVETPDGKGRIVGAAQTGEGWRIDVKLASGGRWRGSADELTGPYDAEALKEFRRQQGDHRESSE
jgi:hypothetical protein